MRLLAVFSWVLGGYIAIAAWTKWVSRYEPSPPPQTLFDRFAGSTTAAFYTAVLGETALGFWLMSGAARRLAVCTAVVLLAGASGLMLAALRSSNPVARGCLGFIAWMPLPSREALTTGIAVNAALIATGAYAIRHDRRRAGGCERASPPSLVLGALSHECLHPASRVATRVDDH
jgi:hypothetical protein